MIKHIVLFKLKEFEGKETKINEIKTAIEGLPSKIDVLQKIEVGLNANANEEYDFCLTADIDTMEGVEIYAKHPDHVAVVVMIKEYIEKRACVDYVL